MASYKSKEQDLHLPSSAYYENFALFDFLFKFKSTVARQAYRVFKVEGTISTAM